MKKLLRFSICLVLATCIFKPVNLKSNDLAKANKYYDRYDYHFAIEIYEKIMRKKPSLEVAQKLANAYRFVNNLDAAEAAYAKVLTFTGSDPINYVYYADILKQKAKFAQAKQSYLLYGQRVPEKADFALKQANNCDVAEQWLQNPDFSFVIENESAFNSDKSDFSPVVFNNGFLFVSDRMFTAKEEKSSKIYGWTGNAYLKIYQAERTGNSVESFKLGLMSELNDQYHNGPVIVSRDGNTLFFTKAGLNQDIRPKKVKKGILHKTIYISQNNNGAWSKPQPFAHNNIYKYSVQHPALSADENILYFASDMPGGFGGMDLYYSEKINGSWSVPVNCGNKINTSEDEVFPYLRDDDKLYFSSRGHLTIGGLDIFSAEGQKNVWTEPENLKAPINSSRDDFGIVFLEGHQSGYLSSNRIGGKGDDDIYRFNIRKAEQFYTVEGKIEDKKTGQPLGGLNIYLINKNTDAVKSVVSAADGTFRFDLDQETDYVLRGDMDKFFAKQEGDISTKGLKEFTVFNVKFEIEKGEDAYLVRLNNIHYDFDKYNIRKDAEPELSRVAEFMKNVPEAQVELRAHTDSRGTEKYNMALSEKRAMSAKKYLSNQGIGDNRLLAKGFGETELLNKCSNRTDCTKEEHQLNRRTEFKVVKINPTLSYVPTPSIKK